MPINIENTGFSKPPDFPTQPARTTGDYINPPMVSQ